MIQSDSIYDGMHHFSSDQDVLLMWERMSYAYIHGWVIQTLESRFYILYTADMYLRPGSLGLYLILEIFIWRMSITEQSWRHHWHQDIEGGFFFLLVLLVSKPGSQESWYCGEMSHFTCLISCCHCGCHCYTVMNIGWIQSLSTIFSPYIINLCRIPVHLRYYCYLVDWFMSICQSYVSISSLADNQIWDAIVDSLLLLDAVL